MAHCAALCFRKHSAPVAQPGPSGDGLSLAAWAPTAELSRGSTAGQLMMPEALTVSPFTGEESVLTPVREPRLSVTSLYCLSVWKTKPRSSSGVRGALGVHDQLADTSHVLVGRPAVLRHSPQ